MKSLAIPAAAPRIQIRNPLVLAAALSTVLLAGTARAQSAPAAAAPSKDIVETAVAAGQFKTLAKALGAADLVKTLQGAGPFTVFAPTDAAFDKLPKGTLEALLADKAKLTAILTYHVVPGVVTAADLASRADKSGYVTLKTVQGSDLKVHLAGKAVHVGQAMANVTTADVRASNGVIHVIDKVLMPR